MTTSLLQQKQKPDNEEQDKQDEAAKAILGQRGPWTTTWRRQRLKQGNRTNQTPPAVWCCPLVSHS